MASWKVPLIVHRAANLVVIAATIKAAVSMVRVILTSAPDFPYYYQAGSEFFKKGSNAIHILPPVSRFVYAPLALIPYPLAQALWVLGSIASILIILGMLKRISGAKLPLPLLWAITYLAFPTQFTLGMGQVNFMALLMVTGAVWYERQLKSIKSGILLALAILCKPELILLLPLFLLTRSWKLLGVVLSILTVTTGVSIGLWGLGDYTAFLQKVAPVFRDSSGLAIYYNQSLSALLVRMGVSENAWLTIAGVVVMGITVFCLYRSKVALPAALWAYLPAFLLVEPIAWQHHLVFLIPTYVWLLHSVTGLRMKAVLAASYVLVAWNFAAPGFLDTIPFGGLIASHGTMGILLVWVLALKSAYET